MRGYLLLGAIAAVVLSLAGAGWWIYTEGKRAGVAECQAERVEASGTAQEAIDLRDRTASASRIDMLDLLRVTIPPIEIKTHETVERIRTVYKDRVVSADCAASVARDDRVRIDLNAARDRANAAVSGLRLGEPVTRATHPGMGQDGRMGGSHDGLVRDSGQSAERLEPLPVWLASVGRYPVAP